MILMIIYYLKEIFGWFILYRRKKGGKKNGKGIEYYLNRKVVYKGDFINEEREGKGKSYYYNDPLEYDSE